MGLEVKPLVVVRCRYVSYIINFNQPSASQHQFQSAS